MDSHSINDLRIQPAPENIPTNKIDILFYESVVRLKRSYTFMVLYQLLKALLYIVFIPIDYTVINAPNSPDILGVMIFACVASVLQMISALIFRINVLGDNLLLLRIAQQIQHVTNEPITASIDKIQNCVSATIFNQQNGTLVSDEGLTEQIKNMYFNYLISNIKELLVVDSPNLKNYDYFAEFSGIVSLVASIAVLAKSQSNTSQLVIIVVYIVLQGLTKLLIITIALMIALSPLVCMFLVCCICCCGRHAQGQLVMPPIQKATQHMILEADGACSICYQNFIVQQNIIRLKCSSKHMFHAFCISSWAKLKETCPICRASIRNPPKKNSPQQFGF